MKRHEIVLLYSLYFETCLNPRNLTIQETRGPQRDEKIERIQGMERSAGIDSMQIIESLEMNCKESICISFVKWSEQTL